MSVDCLDDETALSIERDELIAALENMTKLADDALKSEHAYWCEGELRGCKRKHGHPDANAAAAAVDASFALLARAKR